MASGAGSKGSIILKDSDIKRIKSLRRKVIYHLNKHAANKTMQSVKTILSEIKDVR